MILPLLILIGGFVLLITGADWLVRGSTAMARWLGIPEIAIGLSVIAFGTSLPELIVSMTAAIRGSSEISLANVIGSNIANIFLILGVAALIRPIFAARGTVWKEIPFMMLASVVFLLQLMGIFSGHEGILSRVDGLVLLILFAVFMLYLVWLSRKGEPVTEGAVPESTGSWKVTLLCLPGLVMLIGGGQITVEAAISLARHFNVSERVIGLTIVAIGTSLPELVASSMAAWRGRTALVIGNVVGSNIFNILLVAGASSTVRPLVLSADAVPDISVMLLASGALFLAMFTGRPASTVQRFEGALFLIAYVAYIAWTVFA